MLKKKQRPARTLEAEILPAERLLGLPTTQQGMQGNCLDCSLQLDVIPTTDQT